VFEIPEPVVFPVGTAEELARAVQLTLTVRRGKISQRKLAGRMGVVRTYLTKIEGGKVMPTLDTLEKFARGFEIPLWLLIMEIETMRAMLTEARKEQAL
jgi:transcriptional regulator with XRE-family HTH domain